MKKTDRTFERGVTILQFLTLLKSSHDTKSTREAKRQRGIIAHIAIEKDPKGKTRTSTDHIGKKILHSLAEIAQRVGAEEDE